MKLEQFIIQDGAGYEFTGEYKAPDLKNYYLCPDKEKIVQCDYGSATYKRPIYKLIAPAVIKSSKSQYKFTGKIDTIKNGEFALITYSNENNWHIQSFQGCIFLNVKFPIYEAIVDWKKEPQKTDAPPPFIKQGEDYFLYVKHDVVQKGDWFCSTDGNMIRQALNGIMNINRYIYEKLPLTLIQDGVQYVFTGEYRVPEKNDFAYFNTSKNVYHCSGGGGALPIYITFEDYYWKQYPAMDAAGKKYASFRTAPLLRQWADENMSGAAIQKLQEMNRRELSVTECLQLFEYWLLKNPVLDYGHIEYDKKPLFQYFKCEKENGAYTAQTISIMKAIVYNGAAYEKEKTICFPSGHIEGINHRYQKELSFEELKSLNVQFMSIGKFFSSVNDSQFIESAINYKILE